jgi:integral membrane protein
MPPAPKLASFPAIRGALRFYQVCSIITGTFLLLLVAEMIVKYLVGYELFIGGSGGAIYFSPVIDGPKGLESTGNGLNVSMTILIVHGWFYVVYLFSCFRVWSLMRWPFWRFILLALGGVVPFLSFIMEAIVARDVKRYLAEREAAGTAQPAPATEGAR